MVWYIGMVKGELSQIRAISFDFFKTSLKDSQREKRPRWWPTVAMVSGVDGRAVSMVAVGAILSRQIWPYSPRWYGCMVGAKTGRKNAPNCVCGFWVFLQLIKRYISKV